MDVGPQIGKDSFEGQCERICEMVLGTIIQVVINIDIGISKSFPTQPHFDAVPSHFRSYDPEHQRS